MMVISKPRTKAEAGTWLTRHAGAVALLALVASLAVTSSAEAQPFAYVVGQRNPIGTTAVVSVIDTSTNVRVASITVGAHARGIAVVPDLARAYVANELGESVSVIDLASNTVLTTIAVGDGPTAIVANPDGTRVYVLNGSGVTSVSAIDTATNAVVATTPLAVGQARGMAITPDGARLYVSTYASNGVKVIETELMTITGTIPVGNLATGVEITPDGSRAYVAAYSSNAVSVIDTTTNTVVTTIPVGAGASDARVTPDGTRAYVANTLGNSVSVVNTDTNTVVATVPVTFNPRTLDFTPDGARAYVANSLNVQIIDTATTTVTGTIPFDEAAHGHPVSIVIGRAVGGDPPTAVNNSYTATPNVPLTVPAPGVLANDNTNGGGAMTTELVSDVTGGALTFNADGSFTYTPGPGFSGTASFTYRAANSVGQSNIATVTLTVVSGPQPPMGLYAAAVVGNMVTLRWTPPAAGAAPTGYVLEGGVNPGEVLASLPTGSTAPSVTLVAPTGAFYVRMHTLSGADKSAASNEIRIFVNVPMAPSAPANLLGLVNGSTVSLAWRNTFEGGAPSTLLLDVSGSLNTTLPLPLGETFTFAGVPAGTYTLSLRAANASGASGSSNQVTLTFPGPCSGVPQAPANVVAATDGSLITVVWERATSGHAATGFVLNVTGGFVGSFPTTQQTLSGVVGPGTYTITVQGTNACGTSPASTPQTIVIP
jgi:YVTN family beta-propeller protein